MNKPFRPAEWTLNTNIYEVNVRQYSQQGNFKGFVEHLPRLKDMGIETLWFMPLTPVAEKNRKGSLGSYYACSSYIAINSEFGTEEELISLIRKAHEMGMKVIVDWVANHTGWDHEWTVSNPEFYKKNENGDFFDSHGWDDVIDLDYTNQNMRSAMISAMQYWVSTFNIDGFRCDMAMLTPVDFWMEARVALDIQKNLFWLAELDPLDNPEYMQVFDTAYTWRWMNTARQVAKSGAVHIHELREVLRQYGQSSINDFYPSWFTSNHDENSWNGTEWEKYGEMALPLALFSSTFKGIPLIYSGQELPNRQRLKFFDHDPIKWSDVPELHTFYSQMLHLRKQYDAFSNASYHENCIEINNSVDHHVLTFIRKGSNSMALVAVNFSPWTLDYISLGNGDFSGPFYEVFTGQSRYFNGQNDVIQLSPWGFAVWIK